MSLMFLDLSSSNNPPGCMGISNFFGFLAWGAGILLGIGSFYMVRRRSYALFMATQVNGIIIL